MIKHFIFLFLLPTLLLAKNSQLNILSDSIAAKRKKNSIGIELGYSSGYFKDISFSPLNYHEKGLLLTLNYNRKKSKSLFFAHAQLGSSALVTKYSSIFTSNYYFGDIEIAYLRKLNYEPSPKISFFVGGMGKTDLNFVSFANLNSFTFLFAYSVGIKGIVEYSINSKSDIQLGFALPLTTFLVRPPYNGFDKDLSDNLDKPFKIITNGYLTSLNKYTNLNFNLKYNRTLSKRWDLHLNYVLNYQNLFDINKLIHLQNQFKLGFNYKF